MYSKLMKNLFSGRMVTQKTIYYYTFEVIALLTTV